MGNVQVLGVDERFWNQRRVDRSGVDRVQIILEPRKRIHVVMPSFSAENLSVETVLSDVKLAIHHVP